MFDQIEELVEKFNIINDQISQPEIIADQDRWQKLMREHAELKDIVEKYKEYKQVLQDIDDAIAMLDENLDPDFKELVKEELAENKKRVEPLENELKILLLPKDPNDDKNVVVEIRGGAGGDEAALFAAELYRMYCYYAESNKWKTELISLNENGIGGFKEVIFMIRGQGAYSKMKFESGVHRVQRVPATESSGRIHTSTVTVAVMPEAEELDFKLDMNEVRIDVCRASGNGGQCVNTTDSAVRALHVPTGIMVYCQEEKSQLKNREKALKVLATRLYNLEQEKLHEQMAAEKKSLVGTGNRNERIRTYNFPQGRVTDHRIGLTSHRLQQILDGDLEEVISALIAADQTDKLKSLGNEE